MKSQIQVSVLLFAKQVGVFPDKAKKVIRLEIVLYMY